VARPKKAGRGGYRQPAKPAAVSNPGSGARTDGGAGSKRQPVRVPSGQTYGDRAPSEAQQRAIPLPDTSGPLAGAGGGGAGGAAPPGPVGGAGLEDGVFGPTDRPMEAPTAGAMPGSQPMDPQILIRQLYQKHQVPWLMRLLHDRR